MAAAPWSQGIPFVDPNVEYVGVSRLRSLNASNLGDLSKMFVIQDNDRPLAVIMSYQQYLTVQQKLQEALDTLELLGDQERRNRLRGGLKDADEGRVSPLKSATKLGKK